MASDYIKKPQELEARALESGDWMPLYRWINSPEYAMQVVKSEWYTFVDKDLDIEPGLARVAAWEVRNLRMVANIMRVVSQNAGGKILVLVGVNHKGFLEDYLSRVAGVKVVPFAG